jgi:WD40 repeat protein
MLTNNNANRIKLWNLTIRQEVATLKGHQQWVSFVTFSPDGSTLATAGHKTVQLRRAATFAETDAPASVSR